MRIQASRRRRAGPGTVTFPARGPSAAASKSVNHSDPVGSAPGRLWTV